MQRLIGLFALSMLLVGLSGCSYLSIPSSDYATQAKGRRRRNDDQPHYYDGATAAKARAERRRYRPSTICTISFIGSVIRTVCDGGAGKTPAYDCVSTRRIDGDFWRLWKFKTINRSAICILISKRRVEGTARDAADDPVPQSEAPDAEI